MITIIKYRSIATILFIILLFFTKCINEGKDNADKTLSSHFQKFAGSASCINCHKTIYESHITTAHFHTSEIASENNIKGSFDSGKNKFLYSNGGIVAMERKSNGFFQTAFINGIEKKSQRFDITIGSGTKGQTYLSWAGAKLNQLPITYFTATNQWCNSPGYPDKIAFNRPITSRCLECHTTYAEKLSQPLADPVAIERSRFILGVDCERCHGPAAKHVEFQTQNPNVKSAKFVINPAFFSREQSLDMCALCHGGRLQKTKPSYEFTAGNKLSDYFVIDSANKDATNIDVHGNQIGLLKGSKCFKMSKTLTCITCHNTHENEKGKEALFSQRCITCHNSIHTDAGICKMVVKTGNKIKGKCTACHMPEQKSMAIAVLLQGEVLPTPAAMHTHLIKVYPEETQKVLAFLKKN